MARFVSEENCIVLDFLKKTIFDIIFKISKREKRKCDFKNLIFSQLMTIRLEISADRQISVIIRNPRTARHRVATGPRFSNFSCF